MAQWRDTRAGYGLVSILLHWSNAVIIFAMLALGNAIASSSGADWQHYLRLHTTVAVIAYPLLVWRVVWRVRSRHPGALPQQNRWLVRFAVFVHYLVVALIAAMLVSGPLMAWAGGLPVQVLGLLIAAPFAPAQGLYQTMHLVHVASGSALLVLVVLHIAGALFHIIFRKDRTLDKILLPAVDLSPPARR